MFDTFKLVKKYSDEIINPRTVNDIFIHSGKEYAELNEELDKKDQGLPPGEDGVIGEAIDIIACQFDLIMKEDPNFTSVDFHNYLDKKLQKWKTKYHTPE